MGVLLQLQGRGGTDVSLGVQTILPGAWEPFDFERGECVSPTPDSPPTWDQALLVIGYRWCWTGVEKGSLGPPGHQGTRQ